jgi:hypothetical protein
MIKLIRPKQHEISRLISLITDLLRFIDCAADDKYSTPTHCMRSLGTQFAI